MYAPDIFDPANQVLLADLDTMMMRHPRLRVLLLNSRWDATRYLHTLMSKHANLCLDFASHQGNRALEVFAGWFGADRLLFGTGALDKSPGAAKAFVDYCTLPDEAKLLIAGGNLARLLKLETLPAPYRKRRISDPILAAARDGRPSARHTRDRLPRTYLPRRRPGDRLHVPGRRATRRACSSAQKRWACRRSTSAPGSGSGRITRMETKSSTMR